MESPDGPGVTGMVPVGSLVEIVVLRQVMFSALNPEELHSDRKKTGEIKMWPHGFTL